MEFVYAETDGVEVMDGGADKREENQFPRQETLTLLGDKCGELVGQKSHNAASTFMVAGEKAST